MMEEAADELGDRGIIGEVDCTEQKNLCSRFGISGYPTIKFFSRRRRTGFDYEGERTVKGFVDYVLEQKSLEPIGSVTAVSSRVINITEENVESVLTSGVLVKFFAPYDFIICYLVLV